MILMSKFSKDYKNWTIEDWKNDNWSDKFQCLLRLSDVKARIWCKNLQVWIHARLVHGTQQLY